LKPVADVCLIVEGAYPYVSGGVSSWVHELIQAMAPLSFHVLVLLADDKPRTSRFAPPKNLVGMTEIVLQGPEYRHPTGRQGARLMKAIEVPLQSILLNGGSQDFRQLLGVLKAHPDQFDKATLLNSEPAFELLQRMYEQSVPASSFLQYFWSWRSLVGGMFSVLLPELPRARTYHAVSTGYAGLVMARAVIETGQTGILTEHGIYTNERRIEIAMADWLTDRSHQSLEIESRRRGLRDVWIDAFVGYSRICYELSSRIITLYTGNQIMQERDGAPSERLEVIPNGVDIALYSSIVREQAERRPTIALIGRVVSIKDVKTYIRAVATLKKRVPNVRALVLGPTDEEPAYFRECQGMVAHLALDDCIEFTGMVRVADFFGALDVVVLTSISEAQPLVLLEAGAAGIPAVATDVGSCREILEGQASEFPALGNGGFVTPLADPNATAKAVASLLLDPELRARCAAVMKTRTSRYYSKDVVHGRYRSLYETQIALASPQRELIEVD
jgi:polysaccharide biosynthesis protein PelF